MRNIFLALLFLGLIHLEGFSQEKENYKDEFGYFVIKVTDEVTQKHADNVDSEFNTGVWSVPGIDGGSLLIPVPKPPPILVYKKEYNIHFFIKPDHYSHYTIQCGNNREVSRILKVDRETLIASSFNPFSFEISENRGYYKRHAEEEFTIVEINKNDQKKICGFNCFKLILKIKRSPERIFEMYVTTEIDLNYNPAFANPYLLKEYYPLYIKEYLERYPDDVYKEFVFEKI